jgi:hypothetical protein
MEVQGDLSALFPIHHEKTTCYDDDYNTVPWLQPSSTTIAHTGGVSVIEVRGDLSALLTSIVTV